MPFEGPFCEKCNEKMEVLQCLPDYDNLAIRHPPSMCPERGSFFFIKRSDLRKVWLQWLEFEHELRDRAEQFG